MSATAPFSSSPMNAAGLIDAVRALGLIAPDEEAGISPLAGGVSADVFVVTTASGRRLVVKRSIPRLRVAADWRAPVERDAVEVAWLNTVREIEARLAPEVLGWSSGEHLIVLEWRDAPVWKQEMAAGRVDPAFAGKVGRALARIHAATAGRDDVAAHFPVPANFFALRIDPFLLYTAERHGDVAPRLRELAADLQKRRTALIWGDASPKNILVGGEGPVFLDAETAAMGDPAFDVAFCSTHLLLKTLWLAPFADGIVKSLEAFRDGYLADFPTDAAFSNRAAAIVGALLLARVDGKSPAGYLDAAQDGNVRGRAKAILARPDLDLATLPVFWRALA
ncbi:MAG: phosphotransferase family protein [Caulobacteraceae bacterium]